MGDTWLTENPLRVVVWLLIFAVVVVIGLRFVRPPRR
jgi:hypothetical protein